MNQLLGIGQIIDNLLKKKYDERMFYCWVITVHTDLIMDENETMGSEIRSVVKSFGNGCSR